MDGASGTAADCTGAERAEGSQPVADTAIPASADTATTLAAAGTDATTAAAADTATTAADATATATDTDTTAADAAAKPDDVRAVPVLVNVTSQVISVMDMDAVATAVDTTATPDDASTTPSPAAPASAASRTASAAAADAHHATGPAAATAVADGADAATTAVDVSTTADGAADVRPTAPAAPAAPSANEAAASAAPNGGDSAEMATVRPADDQREPVTEMPDDPAVGSCHAAGAAQEGTEQPSIPVVPALAPQTPADSDDRAASVATPGSPTAAQQAAVATLAVDTSLNTLSRPKNTVLLDRQSSLPEPMGSGSNSAPRGETEAERLATSSPASKVPRTYSSPDRVSFEAMSAPERVQSCAVRFNDTHTYLPVAPEDVLPSLPPAATRPSATPDAPSTVSHTESTGRAASERDDHAPEAGSGMHYVTQLHELTPLGPHSFPDPPATTTATHAVLYAASQPLQLPCKPFPEASPFDVWERDYVRMPHMVRLPCSACSRCMPEAPGRCGYRRASSRPLASLTHPGRACLHLAAYSISIRSCVTACHRCTGPVCGKH